MTVLKVLSDFVGFCRLKTDKKAPYTHAMNNNYRYIPREYLALKINYCYKQLEQLPVVKIYHHSVGGETKTKVVYDKHKYEPDSKRGKYFLDCYYKRKAINNQLKVYENIWNCYFTGTPPKEFQPYKACKSIWINNNDKVVLDKAFFDSLKNDDNTDYPKYRNYFFNGIYYRSAAERDIAIFYTEMGIPFKYEPSITLFGLSKPIHTDFVIYIEELDTCIFHEHLGIKESAEYLRDSRIKYSNYISAGLVPDIDILFTHDKDDKPFDIRFLAAKLNSAVYGTMICNENYNCNPNPA